MRGIHCPGPARGSASGHVLSLTYPNTMRDVEWCSLGGLREQVPILTGEFLRYGPWAVISTSTKWNE